MNKLEKGMRPSSARYEVARHLQNVAVGRDRHAFEALYEHFGPIVKAFMLRKGVAESVAEDLAQETMMTVWRKAALYSPDRGTVSSWIFTIARNLRVDEIRRTSRLSYGDISDFEPESDEPSADQALNDNQEGALVRLALEELSDDQREVIELAFINGLSQSEISTRLRLPLGTVKSRMRLAYQKMSANLKDLR